MVERNTELERLKNADRSLYSGSYTLRALRDSRYHNTAYAVAELIDNSIEADGEQIELLCKETSQEIARQTRNRISGIAVLDTGLGWMYRLFSSL